MCSQTCAHISPAPEIPIYVLTQVLTGGGGQQIPEIPLMQTLKECPFKNKNIYSICTCISLPGRDIYFNRQQKHWGHWGAYSQMGGI